jgi:hypothetical protein
MTTQAVDTQRIRAETVRDLYEKGLLDVRDVARVPLKLRLDVKELALAFGYVKPSEFLQEFVQNGEPAREEAAKFEPWSSEEMMKAASLRFDTGLNYVEIAQRLGKSSKSVQSFFRRTFRQGNVVDRDVWELIGSGVAISEIAELVQLPDWRVQFTFSLWKLNVLCHLEPRYDKPVLLFEP